MPLTQTMIMHNIIHVNTRDHKSVNSARDSHPKVPKICPDEVCIGHDRKFAMHPLVSVWRPGPLRGKRLIISCALLNVSLQFLINAVGKIFTL